MQYTKGVPMFNVGSFLDTYLDRRSFITLLWVILCVLRPVPSPPPPKKWILFEARRLDLKQGMAKRLNYLLLTDAAMPLQRYDRYLDYYLLHPILFFHLFSTTPPCKKERKKDKKN